MMDNQVAQIERENKDEILLEQVYDEFVYLLSDDYVSLEKLIDFLKSNWGELTEELKFRIVEHIIERGEYDLLRKMKILVAWLIVNPT
jgi:hypothetical protein